MSACRGLYYHCRCDGCLEYLPGGVYSVFHGCRERPEKPGSFGTPLPLHVARAARLHRAFVQMARRDWEVFHATPWGER